jgi:4-amino-4-deoxy-L-arabinose transferase-like glycosyltransferase
MLEDNDFVRIRFQNVPRHKKPGGIYWLQAAAVAATGMLETRHIWPYRLPSMLGAVLSVLLVFAFGKRLFDVRVAFLGAVLTASSLLLVIEAHLATTDAMLLAAALTAQGTLGYVYIRSRNGQSVRMVTSLTFWIAQGAGILLKGPVIPFISAITIVGLVVADRKAGWLSRLRPLPGIVLVALIISPWMISISIATDGAFFSDALRSDLLPKLISGHESHGFFPGYYFLLMMVTFWPGSLFAWPALLRAWHVRSHLNIRFCLAATIPTWLAFELIPTKLPHYILPVYPFLALLTSVAILEVADGAFDLARSKLARAAFIVWCLVVIALSAVIVGIPWFLEQKFDLLTLWPLGIAAMLLFYAVKNVTRYRLREITIAAVIGTALILGPTFQTILPNISSLWLSRETAKAIRQLESESIAPPAHVVAAVYHEPSLVFHWGTDIKLVSPEQAAVYLHEFPSSIAVISNDVEDNFIRKLDTLKRKACLKSAIRGFNFTKGHWVILKLYTILPL